MNRQEKVRLVSEMAERFRRSPHLIVTQFQGLTANQAVELRRRIRAAGGSTYVIKNRLARRAAAGTPVEKVEHALTGPRALASHGTDPILLARVLTEFARENPQLELVAGVVDGREVVDAVGIRALASLPGLPELRARLLAVLEAPAARLVRLLSEPARGLARVVHARHEGRGGEEG